MKKRFYKRFITIVIGIIPFGKARIFLYRSLLGYKISYSSSIGMFNIIDCNSFHADLITIGNFNLINVKNIILEKNVTIRKLNRIRYIQELVLCSGSMILSSNIITGTPNYYSPFKNVFILKLGTDSLITSHHYIDCAGKVEIGKNVVFGGRSSEVWTHGFDTKRTMIVGDVTIGDDVYVGSNSKILQGATICDNVSIGAGTIVSKSIKESGFYVSSQLIRKADSADYSNHTQTIEYEGAKFCYKG